MNSDGSNRQTVFTLESDDIYFKFADSGSKLVFVGVDITPQTIYVYDLNSGLLTELTVAYGCRSLDVSPDGETVVYESFSGLHTEIFTINIDGSNRRKLTVDSPGDNRLPRFSPDGEWIVYTALDENVVAHIAIMDTDGSNREILTSETNRMDRDPSFSPDGRFIVFTGSNYWNDYDFR